MTVSRTTDPRPLPSMQRFELLERIGGNVASTVFAARDRRTDVRVAVKMIAADLEDEPETRARFLREAAVTADLQHPNVVRVIEAGEESGRLYIAMELLEGASLRQHLRLSPDLPLEARLRLIQGLCAGLQVAHDRQVVHRDIAPGNLFVTGDGTLKILDFGLARLHSSTLTASGQIVGTLGFMAPEQARGDRVDHRTDLFSAAAVSAFILTGCEPFARGNIASTMEALLNEPPALGDNRVTPAVRMVIERGVAKSPAERYGSMNEFGEALMNAAGIAS